MPPTVESLCDTMLEAQEQWVEHPTDETKAAYDAAWGKYMDAVRQMMNPPEHKQGVQQQQV